MSQHLREVTEAAKKGDVKWLSENLRLSNDELNSECPDLGGGEQYYTPASLAAYHGHLLAMQVLLAGIPIDQGYEKGVDKYTWSSPLIAACEGGHLHIVRWLLGRGADPNQGDDYRTPLFAAISGKDAKVVQCLLDHGANPEARTILGAPKGIVITLSAVCDAYEKDQDEIAEILISAITKRKSKASAQSLNPAK